MKQIKFILFTTILLHNLNAFGQRKLDNLRNNSSFEWVVDSLDKNVLLYYEKNSYADKKIEILKSKINQHLANTINFIGVETYDKPIHYFILEDREKMKLLLGYTTNGYANPKNNFITAIFSENIKSVYSNHELFHLIAMNLWGYPEIWINEGMAVYSDNTWNGHHLHELSKYLIDHDAYISIESIAKKFKKYDAMITYPLLGSFTKFIDETYGRDSVKLIWTKGRKSTQRQVGKSLEELEKEWLFMLHSVTSQDFKYLK